MEKRREHWYEREEVKKVTGDWVKENCKLTPREEELLELVYDRKLVRRDHLEIISESYRNAGDNRTILLNRAIKKLFKMMVIDKYHQKQDIGKGSIPATVAIDKAGSIILGKPHKRRIIQDKHSYKGVEYIKRRLPSNFRHINGVNQLEVDAIQICEKYDFHIDLWELEQPKTFSFNGEEITLIPDVLLLLNMQGKYFAIYIEYDTGSEGVREKEPKVIRDKIINYRRFKGSNLWYNEHWQINFSEPVFPLLLFVTEDKNRIVFFKEQADKLGIQSLAMHSNKFRVILEKLINTINN